MCSLIFDAHVEPEPEQLPIPVFSFTKSTACFAPSAILWPTFLAVSTAFWPASFSVSLMSDMIDPPLNPGHRSPVRNERECNCRAVGAPPDTGPEKRESADG